MYPTEDGKKIGLKIEKHQNVWVCEMDSVTLFEIQQQTGDSFKTTAELYTPDGCCVKCSDTPSPTLIDSTGNELRVGGIVMSGNMFNGCSIGIWIRKNGDFSIGVNC